MNEHDREQERLRYIKESIALVEQYTQGNQAVFDRERMVQDAVPEIKTGSMLRPEPAK